MEQVCKKDDCYGCHACFNICPVNAIKMVEDDLGFYIPEIDQNKCIDCKQCIKVCPALNDSNFQLPSHTYASITNNKEDYCTSTSGGIATALSKTILDLKGVVYGAACIEGLNVQHIRVESYEDLKKLQGSKYVQSTIGNSYKLIKKDLNEDRYVLFVGTPCQVDGLHMYLREKYEKLFTVNIICHGVPSNRLLKEHIKSIAKNVEEVDDLKFRNKESFQLSVYKKNKLLYKNDFYKDFYYLGFMRKISYRNSCYSCKYAQKERVGELTIGDYWGFDKNKPFVTETNYGLSVILVNNDQGEKLVEMSKRKLILQERKLEEAVNGNPQLKYPSKKHRNTERFISNYKKYRYTKRLKRFLYLDYIGYKVLFFLQKH